MSTKPMKMSFLRGQMISSKACLRLAPEIFFLSSAIVGNWGWQPEQVQAFRTGATEDSHNSAFRPWAAHDARVG
jgi:hypothetical protein